MMYKKVFILIFLAFICGVSAFSVFAADQVKITTHFVGSSVSSIVGDGSTISPFTFSFYIGDNLSGITNPIKSSAFEVSGVYTGSGGIIFNIDGDGTTSQTFTLPNVGTTPTPFEFIYKDTTNKINPTSAGTYTYTLNMIPPSGMTIYSFGAEFRESHKFTPPSCADGQSSNEKVKTTTHFVGSSVSSIVGDGSTISPFTFSFYIGDNLSGITNPIKSSAFEVSGVYTGSGGIIFNIDGDGTTSQTFTLPNVGTTPTPFEFIYKDTTNKINPTSAGTYTYTLNMIPPSGMTIYSFGAEFEESHRYKPPACGGYAPSGTLYSATFDTGIAQGSAYNSLLWKGNIQSGKVKFQLATSNSSSGPWNYYGPGCTTVSSDMYDIASDSPASIGCASIHNNKRYFRYKVTICSASNCSSAGSTTPTVDDIIVNWSP